MNFDTARRNMISSQVCVSDVSDPLVVRAMAKIPREKFVPKQLESLAYVDEDLSVGNGRHIMEPMVLARLLQLADVKSTDRAMVICAGTGYSAAVLGHMASSVVALESHSAMNEKATKTLLELGLHNVTVIDGDVTKDYAAQGSYDVILVDGAIQEVPTEAIARLADGGRLVTVIKKSAVGRATLFTRLGDVISHREDFDANVPVLPEFLRVQEFCF